MRNVRDIAKALAAPKARSFASALKQGIKAEFGTARAFAVRLGVTEGRVSQILHGPEPVSPESLERILSAIETPALREEIHAAWIGDFAPLAAPTVAPDDQDSVLAKVDGFMALGKPLRAQEFAKRARTEARNPELKDLLLVQIAQIDLRLGRPASALESLDELEARARASGDRTQLISSLWMRGVALRATDPLPLAAIEAAHRDATSLVGTWDPSQPGPKRFRKQFAALLARDWALAALAAYESKLAGPDALEVALRAAERSIALDVDEKFACTGLEVRARIEVAFGRIVKAEDTLDELAARGLRHGPDLVEKSDITRAKIHLARRQRDAAAHVLRLAADRSLERMDLHHHRAAERILGRLAAER